MHGSGERLDCVTYGDSSEWQAFLEEESSFIALEKEQPLHTVRRLFFSKQLCHLR